MMKSKLLAKKDLAAFVRSLMENHVVYGPKRRRGEHSFQMITNPDEIDLTYTTTILPPKHLLIPTQENLLVFNQDGQGEPAHHEYPNQVIFGMHSCDVNGIVLLDQVFQNHYPMTRYVEQRKNTTIVALTCTNIGETCFCDSMGTGPCPSEGFDLLLTDLEDNYLVESGTRRGEALLPGITGSEAGAASLKEKDAAIAQSKGKFRKKINMDGLPELFQSKLDSPVWKELEQIDLACANCVMSCPTCFCLDLYDRWSNGVGNTVRCVEWDACFLLEFAQVAMGANFRKSRASRVRQFMGHNLSWGGASQFHSKVKHKCVGCGRCIRACPVHIDITEVAAKIRGG